MSERHFVSTVESVVNKRIFEKLLHSSEPLYIQHFQFIFEDIWKNSIDTKERIEQIERGLGSETTKVMENPHQAKSQLVSMIENSKDEILMVFPTLNVLKRHDNARLIDMLIDKSHLGIKIKILSPIDKYTKRILLEKNEASNDKTENIIIRGITNQHDIKSTIVMIDKKKCINNRTQE